MQRFRFKPGLTVTIEGKQYKLLRLIDKAWHVENTLTGAFSTLSVDELIAYYLTSGIGISGASQVSPLIKADKDHIFVTFEALDPQVQETLKSKRQFLETYLHHYGEHRSLSGIQSAIDHYWAGICPQLPQPSASSVYRMLVSYLRSEKNILSLLGNKHRRGNRKRRLNIHVEKLCLDAIQEIYLKLERGTKKATLSKARVLVREENRLRPKEHHLPIPTESTIQQILNQLPAQDVYAARYGVVAARRKFRNSIHSALVERPLQRVEIDHTRLDLFIVDEITGLVVDRPWLTLVIDVYTRAILGFCLTLSPPGLPSLAAALKMSILPKASLCQGIEKLVNQWEMHGIPESIVCDNGYEFHGRGFEQACYMMGINIAYCPRKTPWWKGTIERAIGTLNREISGLIPGGRTFHSIAEKGEYDPKKHAIITMSTLRQCIIRWIIDVYHPSHHRGIDTSPLSKWMFSASPEDILIPENPHLLDAITGQIDMRNVWHYGVELNHVIYNSLELGQLRDRFKGKATIRWNAEDLGSITVMLPGGGVLNVPAIPKFKNVNGLSLYQYKLCRQDLINKGIDPENSIEIDLSIQKIRDAFAEDAKRTRKTLRSPKTLPISHSYPVTPEESSSPPLAHSLPMHPMEIAPSIILTPIFTVRK